MDKSRDGKSGGEAGVESWPSGERPRRNLEQPGGRWDWYKGYTDEMPFPTYPDNFLEMGHEEMKRLQPARGDSVGVEGGNYKVSKAGNALPADEKLYGTINDGTEKGFGQNTSKWNAPDGTETGGPLVPDDWGR